MSVFYTSNLYFTWMFTLYITYFVQDVCGVFRFSGLDFQAEHVSLVRIPAIIFLILIIIMHHIIIILHFLYCTISFSNRPSPFLPR